MRFLAQVLIGVAAGLLFAGPVLWGVWRNRNR
jgi:hypothetical protein